MIAIENLYISYGDHRVLDGLSLLLPGHCIHGLVGMNGAGKTTLLNTLAGFIRPGSGTILVDGTGLKRGDLAFLETENFFYSNITGREYLGLFRAPQGAPGIDEWNRMFKLPLDQLISGYSSGMKRKLALAGVLRQNKQVVILDEPFNGLDLESSRLLSMIIARLKERGNTVLITSHILGSLTGICDHIHLLRDGKIVLSREKEHFETLEQDIFRDVDPGYFNLVNSIISVEGNEPGFPAGT
ncbi:MAG: ATP-binding cassette domain-containing protein [Bacteroidetes bacterium]|nr:ATP-binding cassette domain-containing protein [Bacteroidota bacterium]